MRAYLVRHGEAKHENVDPDRHLTDRGVEDVKHIAADAVNDLGVRPALIVHSGKARARQTAEIWAGLVEVSVAVEQADGLSPNDNPSSWATRLDAEDHDVMLVGHLPFLDRLTGLLVMGDAEREGAGFPAGGLVVLERVESGWSVVAARP